MLLPFSSSANATPDFEGRGGDDLAEEVSNSLSSAYKSQSAFDLSQLCILKGRKCWKLYVDILVGTSMFVTEVTRVYKMFLLVVRSRRQHL